VKRLVMKSVPEGTTRVAMLKKGEADMAFLLDGPDAETVTRDGRLSLAATRHASAMWIEFADQWDPRSPWHDRRVRLAVNHALDRKAIRETACLGYCPPAGIVVPPVMDFALQVEPPLYDPQKARQLLAEAGYPKGFDAGDFTPLPGFWTTGEAAVNYLNAVGIRAKLRPMERAAFYAAWQENKPGGLPPPPRGNPGKRRHPPRGVRLLEGQLRIRRVSRHGRVVPAAGPRARSREARSPAPSHSAAHHRPRHVRADLEHASVDRRRAAGARSHDQSGADVDLSVLRGHAAQEPIGRRGQEEPMRAGLRAYDADTHVNPCAEILDRYVDPDFRRRLPELAPYRTITGQIGGTPDTHQYRVDTKSYRRVLGEARAHETFTGRGTNWRGTKQPRAGVQDDHAGNRVKDMDDEGTDVHFLVATSWVSVVGLPDVELEVGLTRAYHRHAADFCGQFPTR